MADFGGVSLSEEEERSPGSMTLLSGGGGVGMSTRSRRLVGNSPNGNTSSGGEMGEIVRKPRGRPPGSKNKPKPPIVITRNGEPVLKPVVLEIGPGVDVVEQIVEYARRRCVCIGVLSGSGTVSSVTLRHPLVHAPTLSLHGPLNIVALSGSYLGPSCPNSSASFSLSLAGSQGQVFGGIVGGKVTAQTPVVVVATTFSAPSVQHLPGADAGGCGGGDGEDHREDKKVKVNSGGGGGMSEGESGGGMGAAPGPQGMYNVGGQTQEGAVGGLNGPQISAEMLNWGSSPVGTRSRHRY